MRYNIINVLAPVLLFTISILVMLKVEYIHSLWLLPLLTVLCVCISLYCADRCQTYGIMAKLLTSLSIILVLLQIFITLVVIILDIIAITYLNRNFVEVNAQVIEQNAGDSKIVVVYEDNENTEQRAVVQINGTSTYVIGDEISVKYDIEDKDFAISSLKNSKMSIWDLGAVEVNPPIIKSGLISS